MKQRINNINAFGGFSLVEVLITMFILVVGLLGLAIMQLNSTQNNNDSYVRTQAVAVAQSLADRIRLNGSYVNQNATSPIAVIGSDNIYSTNLNYELPISHLNYELPISNDPWLDNCLTIPTSLKSCKDDGSELAHQCTVAELAKFDAWEVACMGAAVHPGFKISVECADSDSSDIDDCSPYSIHKIITSWPSVNPDLSVQTCPANSAADPRSCVIISTIAGGN